jgi:DNA-binding NtrC family response regulator
VADGSGAPRPTIPIREIDADEDVTRLKPKPKLRRPNADAETVRAETARAEKPAGGDSISVLGVGLDDSGSRRPSPPRHKREEREDEDDDQNYLFAETVDEEETLSLEAKEIELIKKSLERNKGKRKAAADELGISERTLYRKIKQYDL